MITPLLLHKERLARTWETCTDENTRQELAVAIHQVDTIIADQMAEEVERLEEFRALIRRA